LINPPPDDPHPGWPQADAPQVSHLGWALKNLDLEIFCQLISSTSLILTRGAEGTNSAILAAEALDIYTSYACNASMPLRTPCPGGRKPVYWWSLQIAELRSTTLSLRWAYQSCLIRHGPDEAAVTWTNFA